MNDNIAAVASTSIKSGHCLFGLTKMMTPGKYWIARKMEMRWFLEWYLSAPSEAEADKTGAMRLSSWRSKFGVNYGWNPLSNLTPMML